MLTEEQIKLVEAAIADHNSGGPAMRQRGHIAALCADRRKLQAENERLRDELRDAKIDAERLKSMWQTDHTERIRLEEALKMA
jgi:hypothetical protein